MNVTLIAAHGLNGVIGNEGDMPWHLSTDLRFFRKQTEGHIVVMGRKTHESIGRALPNRRNIVLSRHLTAKADDIEVYNHIDDVITVLETAKSPGQDIFIIGGGQIYEAFLPYAKCMYITIVEAVIAGDTYFPRIKDDWHVALLETHDEPPEEKPKSNRPWYPHRMYRLTRSSDR